MYYFVTELQARPDGILGYANNQILPIEGSTYETHYADGTEVA